MGEQEVKLSHKEKVRQNLFHRYFEQPDIKYRGPLSYRHIRILAWVFLAIQAFLTVSIIGRNVSTIHLLHPVAEDILAFFGDLSTPLFLMASFAIILTNRKNFRNLLIVYLTAFIAFSCLAVFAYLHYIHSLMSVLGMTDAQISNFATNIFGSKIQLNVFVDLSAFASIHFFISYKPNKHFQGKKIYIFRWLALLPALYIIAGYVLRVLNGYDVIKMPFYLLALLPTKSPLVHALFTICTIWLRNREKLFKSLGASDEQYHEFLKTNRNSLSFSVHVCLLIVIFALLDFIVTVIFAVLLEDKYGSGAIVESKINLFCCGQCFSLLLAMPIILLFSYNKTHKDKTIDVIIPVAGLALVAFAYLEGAFQIILDAVTV